MLFGPKEFNCFEVHKIAALKLIKLHVISAVYYQSLPSDTSMKQKKPDLLSIFCLGTFGIFPNSNSKMSYLFFVKYLVSNFITRWQYPKGQINLVMNIVCHLVFN